MSRQYITAFVAVAAVLAAVTVSAQHPRSITIVSTEAPDGWEVPRLPDGRPDLQGIWANDTATPLQRPETLGDRATLTEEEVAALQEHAAEIIGSADDAVFLKALASVEGQPPAPRYSFYSYGQQWLGHRWFDNRTSLIIDPPNGRLPPRSAEAQERAERQRAARNTPAPTGFQNVSEELDRLDPGVRCRGGRSGFFVATHRPSSAMYRQWSCGGHHASMTHAQQS